MSTEYEREFGPLPEGKELIDRLLEIGCTKKEVAKIVGISTVRLWEITTRSPDKKAKRNEYMRRWMRERYQPKTREGLKPSEAARIAGVSSGLVRRWIRQGRLPAENVSRSRIPHYYIDPIDLDRFLTDRLSDL